MHKELYIARGVMKTPGDTLSAEQGLSAINLLDAANGFSLTPTGGWIPQIVGMKNGGVWADSAVNTGRQLTAGEDGNVTETIRLTIAPGDFLSLFKQVTRLNRFIQDCRRFHTTFYQIEPVFLWWWADCAPGPQYAKVFYLDMTVEYSGDQSKAVADVVLTLEREPYWRALPPGANPKIWAYYARGEKMDSTSDYSLMSGTTEHFAYSNTVYNRHEWASATVPAFANYIDILGRTIPGDAPALALVGFSWSANTDQVHIARVSKPLSYPERAFSIFPAGTAYRFGTLNASDGSLGTDATEVTDTGGVIETGGVTRERVNISFGTIANSRRVSWEPNAGNFDLASFSGNYAVFARARQVNGAFGDVLLQMRLGTSTSNVIQTFNQIPVTLSGTTGNTTSWPIHYLGEITLPFNSRMPVNADGLGVTTGFGASGSLQLWSERLTGVGVLYICDVILIPFDEEYVKVIIGNGATDYQELLDTTGYISHGETFPIAVGFDASFGQQDFAEVQGNGITLMPNTDNRLYFWGVQDGGSGDLGSTPLMNFTVRVNIVPRWRGVRDV